MYDSIEIVLFDGENIHMLEIRFSKI